MRACAIHRMRVGSSRVLGVLIPSWICAPPSPLHTYTHTHTYIQTDRDRQTDRRTDGQTYIHTYMHAYMHTYLHTCIHVCSTRQGQLEAIMVDALILARCEAFVGQFKSHLSRLFWELAIDTQMRVVPYVSLDRSSWCWGNWGSIKC